jgi:3-dehydroquinate dehydratase-2
VAGGRKILIINGPNLNLLGTREPTTYGTATLGDIAERLQRQAEAAGATLSLLQSNSEAELVECIQRAAREQVDFIIINPAAYTHTSIAIRDALAAAGIPFVEVHLSNVHARERYRHHSYLSDLAAGTICGWGAPGYELALAFALREPPATSRDVGH